MPFLSKGIQQRSILPWPKFTLLEFYHNRYPGNTKQFIKFAKYNRD